MTAFNTKIVLLAAVLLLFGCAPAPTPTLPVTHTPYPITHTPLPITPPPTPVIEQPVIPIPLAGPVAGRNAEVSGLAWYSDTLIILPQYPGRFPSDEDGRIFALPKAGILAFLDGDSDEPLTPQEVLWDAPGLAEQIPGFQGYEAIAFLGERAFVTIEAETGSEMMGYLVAGEIAPDLSVLRLDPDTLVEIPPPADLNNMSDETLLVAGDTLVTIYEANGANVNPDPAAHLFDLSLQPADPIPFPNIEYRITDATALDDAGRFWAINYLWPGDADKLDPADDPLAVAFGQDPTHAGSAAVERLLQFQYAPDGITLLDTSPIQLALRDDGEARNWEGVVRLDEMGFVLMTDKFPETILAFVGG